MVWLVLIQTVGMDQRAELVFFSCVYQWSYGLARRGPAFTMDFLSRRNTNMHGLWVGNGSSLLLPRQRSKDATAFLRLGRSRNGMREMRPMNECMRGRAFCGRHARGNRTNDKKKEQEHSHVCNGDSYPLSSMTAVAT